MSVQPPPGADLRLWQQAYDLAEQHSDRNGRCAACGTSAPCRIATAAAEAMRRAVPSAGAAADAATGEMPTQVIAERPDLSPPPAEAAKPAHWWSGEAEPEAEEVWEQAIPEPGESWQPPRLVRRPSKVAAPAPDPEPAPSRQASRQADDPQRGGAWQQPGPADRQARQQQPPSHQQASQQSQQPAWGAPGPQGYQGDQPYPGAPHNPPQQVPQRYPGQQMQHEGDGYQQGPVQDQRQAQDQRHAPGQQQSQWQQGAQWQPAPPNAPQNPPPAWPQQPPAQQAANPGQPGPAVPPQGGPWRHGHPSGPQPYVNPPQPAYPPQQEQGGWEENPAPWQEPSAETSEAEGVWEQLIPEPGDPWLPPRPSAVRQGGVG
ncbi:MAG: hypothetical protein QOD41_402, partial [Cryptosporangiaceae bacterium]|nr:hypothetical protein [Cryptosporangiaceae bacterium]